MPQSTNLNVNPFYDDFDPTNQYYRVLFRPSQAVQARELTQLQSILQNQIEEFGLNILQQGTIVRGCTFTFVKSYPFVKLQDNDITGAPINVSAFANGYAQEATTNLTAKIFNYVDGLESQSPNLNTLFVRYINAGNTGTTVFANNSVLNIYANNYCIQTLTISANGTGYDNTDILVFTSSTGTGATGTIRTNANGSITSVSLTDSGNNYLTAPTVTIANSSSGTSNGSSAIIVANSVIAAVTTATNTASTSNTETFPTGTGYGFRISDGVIFQKGFFLYVEPQEIIVTPYNTTPSNLVIGFDVTETIVNNSVDTSLNDNANGVNNDGAPGAYRLKMDPTLVLKSTANASTSNDFFTLVEFQAGVPTKQRQDTQYATLGKELAKRTFEESGNYVVKPFDVTTDDMVGNSSYLQAWVSSGVGYINGYRVEQFGRTPLPIRKGNDVRQRLAQIITPHYSSYVLVDNFVGNFPFNSIATVSLRDAAATQIAENSYTAGSAPGNELGTAQIRCVLFDNGTPGGKSTQYRIYLFNIVMSPGKNFANVRCVFYDGATKGAADIVLDAYNNCSLVEPERNAMVFPFGKDAIKTLRDLSNTNDTVFTYRTYEPSASFNTSGICTLSASGSQTFPYTAGSTLTADQKNNIIVMLTASANGGTAISGTVTTSGNTVVGSSTAFTTQLAVGDYIIANTEVRRITTIGNNTYATVESNWGAANGAGITIKRNYPAYRAVPLSHSILTRTANVDSNSNTLTIALGETISGTTAALVTYDVNRNAAVQLTKTLYPAMIVKLNMSSATIAAQNKWCLGVPDAFRLVSVTKGTNADYVTGQTDYTSEFQLDNGQHDSFYGMSYLVKKVGSTLTVSSGDYLVVTFDVLKSANTGSGAGFYSVDSYPVDDTITTAASDKIRTEDIPTYFSVSTGVNYNLRDCVDFRPQVTNTAAYANVLASANINPANTIAFTTTEAFFPNPTDNFLVDYQYYIGRIDKIIMNSLGQLSVLEGPLGDSPNPPRDQPDALTIASINVPPFPTLSSVAANNIGRPDYGASVGSTSKQIQRLTMKDLSGLKSRVENLEYYTSLSLLEQATKDLVIPSDLDPTLNRFKHGIFVDSFVNSTLSNTTSSEYRASIDIGVGQLIPTFDQTLVDLELAANNDLVVTGDAVSIAYTEANLISQPFDTRTRQCSDDHWTFAGTMELIPSIDHFFDVQPQPAIRLSNDTSNTQPSA